MIIKKKAFSKEPSSKKVVRAATEYIRAAEEDEEADDFDIDDFDDTDGLSDAIDNVADSIEDIKDSVDDMDEDDVEIAVNNNIADHYIAECSRCNGVFISAVVESDQVIDCVTGTCPLCGRETEQYLKWVIKSVEED